MPLYLKLEARSDERQGNGGCWGLLGWSEVRRGFSINADHAAIGLNGPMKEWKGIGRDKGRGSDGRGK